MMLQILATTLILALCIGLTNRNVCIVSSQIDALQADLRKIKNDIEEIKKATGENAFDAMLDKPIPTKYMCTEDLYKFHGGQVR